MLQKINTTHPARLAPRRRVLNRPLSAVALLAMVSALAPKSQAALSTNITDMVTDLTTFFGSIQTLVISVVIFGLAIGYAKLMRKK